MTQQDSEQARQLQIAGTVAPLLSDGALAFFALYFILVAFDIFPPRLLDPLWMLTTASSLCNSMTIPLAGLALLHLSAALDPMNNRIQARRTFYSRLAAWVALGFLLLLPLIGYANWRGIRNVTSTNVQAVAGVKRNAARLISQIQTASTPQDLQGRLRRFQGPILPDSELAQPLPQLKKQAVVLVNQVLNRYLSSIPSPRSEAFTEIYRQSLRTALMALVGSLASACLAWDPRSSTSILRQLFNSESSLIKSFILRPQQKIDNLLKEIKIQKAQSAGRDALRRQSDGRIRQQKQAKQEVERKMKRSQAEQRKMVDRLEKERDKRGRPGG
jgi:hypothetical protein